MDNYVIISFVIIATIILLECIFSKNRKNVILSLFDILKSLFRLFITPVFQVFAFYEIIVITILCYFKLCNYTIIKLIYSYLSFLALVIMPVAIKITFNTRVYRLVTLKIMNKFTLVSLFTFLIKSFEPNLLISSLIVLFFIFKSFVEALSKQKLAFPLITNLIGLLLALYSIFMFIRKLSWPLIQQLLTAFMIPICFWMINIPLLFLFRYLMELDRTINWINVPFKLLLIFKILLTRIYWIIKLHKVFEKLEFNIVNVKLDGLGKKVYTITTDQKMNKQEQEVLMYGYRYLILNAKFYKGCYMTFPIAINLVYKNNKYYNWHYRNIDSEFVDLVE